MAIVVVTELWGSPLGSVYAGIGVVAGHNWPIFLGFRGGKGAATVLGVSLAIQPWLTLIALAPAILGAALLRNVVLGVAFGFVLLIVVTGQGWMAVLLCLSLTLVVTGTYLGRSWRQSLAAVRQRRWVTLFSFE